MKTQVPGLNAACEHANDDFPGIVFCGIFAGKSVIYGFNKY